MLLEFVIGGAIGLFVIVAILIYYSRAMPIFKIVALPYTMVAAAALMASIIPLAGAPIEKFPEGKWDYISHRAEQQGKVIVLWVWVREWEDTRLYRFPYSRDTMKKLNKAKGRNAKGEKIVGKFSMDGKKRRLQTEKGTAQNKDRNTIKQ